MGIKRLNKFLSNRNLVKKYRNMEDYVSYKEKRNIKIIAVDIMLYIYKFKYSYNDIIFGFMKQIIHFLNNKIVPVYVFDGAPISEKMFIINNRKNRRKNLVEKINKLTKEINDENRDDIKEKISKLSKSNINITIKDIKKIKKLLTICHIPFIQSCHEADISIAKLYKENKIDGCMSEDMDILAFGCKKMIKLANSNIYEYNLDFILSKLQLDKDKFIDMCIFLGCDYIKPIIKNSPDEIYKLVKNNSFKEIIDDNKENCDINKYTEEHNKIKNIFKFKFRDSYSYKCKFSIMKHIELDKLLSFLVKNFTEKRDVYLKKSVRPNINRINGMINNRIFR